MAVGQVAGYFPGITAPAFFELWHKETAMLVQLHDGQWIDPKDVRAIRYEPCEGKVLVVIDIIRGNGYFFGCSYRV